MSMFSPDDTICYELTYKKVLDLATEMNGEQVIMVKDVKMLFEKLIKDEKRVGKS